MSAQNLGDCARLVSSAAKLAGVRCCLVCHCHNVMYRHLGLRICCRIAEQVVENFDFIKSVEPEDDPE